MKNNQHLSALDTIMEPTLKNMLLAQIGRLDKSKDDLDRQLRTYLISVIKDRKYPQDSWIGEIEEVEQMHRLVKKGETVISASFSSLFQGSVAFFSGPSDSR